jgi:hypothetical protein
MQKFESYSHEQQDEFIYNIFDHKTNGYFLDIAAGHPIIGSNTYSLEKFNQWTGFGFDIVDSETYGWSEHRTSNFVQMDVCSEEFTTFLKNNIPQDLVVDYVSLDVNGPTEEMVTTALQRVIDAGVKFKAVTFEHEVHRGIDINRTESRKLLEGLGLVRLFEDVRLWGIQYHTNPTNQSFEDWWIDPQYFDPKLLEAARADLFYPDVIKVLQENRNNPYEVIHHCCRAFREEYDTFWHEADFQDIIRWYQKII